MKILTDNIPRIRLVENTQQNPIRWVCLEQVDSQIYKATTPVFKCKDYFNDFAVYKHTGKKFQVYGMHSDWVVFDKEGGLSVLALNTAPHFIENVCNVLGPTLIKDWGLVIKMTPVPHDVYPKDVNNVGDHTLIWFSPECFKNTFCISLLTLLLRCCNTKDKVKDISEFYDNYIYRESGGSINILSLLFNKEWNKKEYINEYLWYYNDYFYQKLGSAISKGSFDGMYVHSDGASRFKNNFAPVPSKEYTTLPPIHKDGKNIQKHSPYVCELTDTELDLEDDFEEEEEADED